LHSRSRRVTSIPSPSGSTRSTIAACGGRTAARSHAPPAACVAITPNPPPRRPTRSPRRVRRSSPAPPTPPPAGPAPPPPRPAGPPELACGPPGATLARDSGGGRSAVGHTGRAARVRDDADGGLGLPGRHDRVERQLEHERRALAGQRLDVQLASVGLHEPARD